MKKENPVLRNERKKLFKNKTLYEGNQIIRNKNENNYENKNKKSSQQKEKLREKNLNHLATNHHLLNNSNVYKPNKKLFSKQNIVKDLEKNNIYSHDIKLISDNTNKISNINSNIITNTYHNYIKSEIKEKINDSKKDKIIINIPYENSSNTSNLVNYNRISRINNEINNLKRKYRIKNTSVELRHRRKLNRNESIFDDIDENNSNDDLKTDRNCYINSNFYKSISPDLHSNNYKYETFVDFRNDILSDKIGENYNTSKYVNEGSQKMIYYYNKANSNYFNLKRNENNIINRNEDRNRATNNFYTKDNYSNFRNMNINYFNYINSKGDINLNRSLRNRQHVNSMIIEANNQYSSFDVDNNDNNNTYINKYRNEGYKSCRRRSKNKIRITKSNNPNIVEYNLDISDIIDDENDYKSEYNIRNNHDKYIRFNNLNFKKKNDLKKYYFTKNIRPIKTTQFSIQGIINNAFNRNTLSRNNEAILKKQIESTPNFSEMNNKAPKRSNSNNIQKKNELNKNNFNRVKNSNIIAKNININIEDDHICSNKVLIKKRPKNEIPKPISLNKRKNTSSSLISDKNNIKVNTIFEICKRDNININPSKESIDKKFCFDKENEIIDFINMKYEEEKRKKSYFNKKLRFTGFVLSKKYKGKNLYDIRIEDDLDKINNQLKEEQVNVNNKKVELKFVDDKNDVENNDNNDIYNRDLEEEIQKLKKENEKIYKKDISKNDFIEKLDKEKKNLLEEIEKMKKNIEDLNNVNIKLNKDLERKMNKNIFLKVENNSFFSINIKNKKNNVSKENINKNDPFKNYINIQSNNNKNKNNNKLDINQILCDLINGEKIDGKTNENHINNKSDIDNNIKELNNNKKLLDLIEGILKIDEINKKLNSEDNKDIINNSSINESSINDFEIYNQSHPRINDLLSEMSEKEEFNNNKI